MQGNPRELSMPRTVGVGLLFVVALTACAHFKGSPSPAAEAPARSAPDVQPSSDGQTAVAAPDTLPATPPAEPPATGSPAAGSPATGGPPAAASRPPPSPEPSTAKPARPKTAGNGNPKHGAPAAAQTAAAQPVAKPPASPPLDLAGLEQRLKDTHAIGLFTKLSLKNQVDDLLGAFRAFHGGQTQPPLADLRQRYDLLLLKVLTLLQDGDPPLASAISASREAIWALLADRDKFQKIQMS
jgi:hypothetical protein